MCRSSLVFLEEGVCYDQCILLAEFNYPFFSCILFSKAKFACYSRYLLFSWRDLYSFPFCCFPLFLCIDRWGRLSYLFLLFFGTLHSDVYIFPFLLCFSLLFFSQLFVRPPQTAILLFCISFSWGWSWFLSPVQCELYIGDNCTVPCTWPLRQFKTVCQTQEWAILFLSKATILREKTDIKLRT